MTAGPGGRQAPRPQTGASSGSGARRVRPLAGQSLGGLRDAGQRRHLRDIREDVDLRSTEHLDERWVLPCEFTAHQGDDPAEWILFPSCCSATGKAYFLGCEACRIRKTSEQHSIVCDVCRARYVPASRAWRRIEPINT